MYRCERLAFHSRRKAFHFSRKNPVTAKKRKSLKVKSGRLQWRFSKRHEKLRAELAETHRLAAATRKREHGEVPEFPPESYSHPRSALISGVGT